MTHGTKVVTAIPESFITWSSIMHCQLNSFIRVSRVCTSLGNELMCCLSYVRSIAYTLIDRRVQYVKIDQHLGKPLIVIIC